MLRVSSSFRLGLGWPWGHLYPGELKSLGCMRVAWKRLRGVPTVASDVFFGTHNCHVPSTSLFTFAHLCGIFPGYGVCIIYIKWKRYWITDCSGLFQGNSPLWEKGTRLSVPFCHLKLPNRSMRSAFSSFEENKVQGFSKGPRLSR